MISRRHTVWWVGLLVALSCVLVPFWTVLVVRSAGARAACFSAGKKVPAIVYRYLPPRRAYLLRVAREGPSGAHDELWIVDFDLQLIGSGSSGAFRSLRSFGFVALYDGGIGVLIGDPVKMERDWTWSVGRDGAELARADYRCELTR
jgi:hypothetical protein